MNVFSSVLLYAYSSMVECVTRCVFECVVDQVFEWIIVRIFKCTTVPLLECGIACVLKCTTVRVLECVTVVVCLTCCLEWTRVDNTYIYFIELWHLNTCRSHWTYREKYDTCHRNLLADANNSSFEGGDFWQLRRRLRLRLLLRLRWRGVYT